MSSFFWYKMLRSKKRNFTLNGFREAASGLLILLDAVSTNLLPKSIKLVVDLSELVCYQIL